MVIMSCGIVEWGAKVWKGPSGESAQSTCEPRITRPVWYQLRHCSPNFSEVSKVWNR